MLEPLTGMAQNLIFLTNYGVYVKKGGYRGFHTLLTGGSGVAANLTNVKNIVVGSVNRILP